MTNKKYKDGVFTSLFSDKKKILELFNALQGTDYGADTDIQIQTLSDVLYSVRKNDLAFSINNRFVVLAEHQSTICANMALRFLSYVARVYEKMVDNRLVYSETRIPLPIPEFFVLYNGVKDFPAESVYRLSDSFITKPQNIFLDLEVKVININPDKRHTVLEGSTTLLQYSLFVEKVRDFVSQKFPRDEAIKQAINWCINHDILQDFLKNNGSEVCNMLFEEYNVETAIEVAREDAKKETREYERTSIALKFLQLGIPLEDISKGTGLTLPQIIELKNKQAKVCE